MTKSNHFALTGLLFAVMAVTVRSADLPPAQPILDSSVYPASCQSQGRACCEPGYRIVEEICYQDVVRKCCKVVPDVKKVTHTIYDCKCEDYCLPRCNCLCHHCKSCEEPCQGCFGSEGCLKSHCDPLNLCPMCGKPRVKKILMKKIITEECPTFKCVVECYVEKVPVKVYRKVPCCQGPIFPSTKVIPHVDKSGEESDE